MKTELIVALDIPSSSEIPAVIDPLPDEISFYKVGLELFTSEGPQALQPLQESGKSVFLDLKLHDIPRTVARAVRSAGKHGVQLLTLHASGGKDMLTAAAESAGELGSEGPKLLAITVLTSLAQADMDQLGVSRTVGDQAMALAELAVSSGIHGLVCSALEAERFRAALGDTPLIVTPGIRPAGGDVGDQKRVATPEMAVEAGASHIVVGRPILQAEDPAQAARGILDEIRAAT